MLLSLQFCFRLVSIGFENIISIIKYDGEIRAQKRKINGKEVQRCNTIILPSCKL
jgi:hypothetical protein